MPRKEKASRARDVGEGGSGRHRHRFSPSRWEAASSSRKARAACLSFPAAKSRPAAHTAGLRGRARAGGGRREAGPPSSPAGGRRGTLPRPGCGAAGPRRPRSPGRGQVKFIGSPGGKRPEPGRTVASGDEGARGGRASRRSGDRPSSPRATRPARPLRPGAPTSGLAGAGARLQERRQPGPRPCPHRRERGRAARAGAGGRDLLLGRRNSKASSAFQATPSAPALGFSARKSGKFSPPPTSAPSAGRRLRGRVRVSRCSKGLLSRLPGGCWRQGGGRHVVSAARRVHPAGFSSVWQTGGGGEAAPPGWREPPCPVLLAPSLKSPWGRGGTHGTPPRQPEARGWGGGGGVRTASGPWGGVGLPAPTGPSCCPRRPQLRWGVAANFSLCLIFRRCGEERGGGGGDLFQVCRLSKPRGKTFLRSPWDTPPGFFPGRGKALTLQQRLKLQPRRCRPDRNARCGAAAGPHAAAPSAPPAPRSAGAAARGGSPGLAADPRHQPRSPPPLSPPHAAGSPGRRLEPGSASHGPGNRFYLNVRCYFYSSWVRPGS